MAALPGADGNALRVAASAVVPDLRGRRVYIVDDEQDVLRGTRTLLELWNLEVHGAQSAAAAEQLCAQNGAPDLMIADLRLGEGENGAQLAARLQRTFGQFAVLIISGETTSGALKDTELSSFPLLHKPVTPEVFRAAVSHALI
jgi:two-component system, sensor histidine kinase